MIAKGIKLYKQNFMTRETQLQPRSVLQLDNNLADAIRKMGQLEEIFAKLPGLDCGSCGSPTCRSLAEDIVLENAQLSDCVFILREQVNALAEELLQLAQKRPRALREAEPKGELNHEGNRITTED